MCFWLHFLEIIFYDCSCLLTVLVVRRAENLLFHSQRFSESELQGLKYNPEAYEMPVNTHIVYFCYLRHGKTAFGALSWDTNIFQVAQESCRAAGIWQSQESKNLTVGMEKGQTTEVIKNRLEEVCKIIKNHCSSPVIHTARGKVKYMYDLGLLPAGGDPWLKHNTNTCRENEHLFKLIQENKPWFNRNVFSN